MSLLAFLISFADEPLASDGFARFLIFLVPTAPIRVALEGGTPRQFDVIVMGTIGNVREIRFHGKMCQ